MLRSRSSKLVAAGFFAAGLAAWFLRPSETGRHLPMTMQAEHAAPADVEPGASLAPTVAETPVAAESSSPVNVAAEKRARAAEGEAGRIAAREAKLTKLDWAAPRPGPPESEDHRLSKREAEMTAAERLAETQTITTRLKERIQRMDDGIAAGRPSEKDARPQELLRARLEQRVAELARTAAKLRAESERGSAPPAEGSGVDGHP